MGWYLVPFRTDHSSSIPRSSPSSDKAQPYPTSLGDATQQVQTCEGAMPDTMRNAQYMVCDRRHWRKQVVRHKWIAVNRPHTGSRLESRGTSRGRCRAKSDGLALRYLTRYDGVHSS